LRRGNATAIASDATGVAHAIRIPNPLGRCKVQRRERARLSKHVSILILAFSFHDWKDLTYGLGIGASSSNALTIGANDGTAGEYGRLSPNGLSDRPAALSR